MLLATASFTLPCHASAPINGKNSNTGSSCNNTNNNTTIKSQKLARLQTSQKNSPAVVAATTTAALMKTIAVRANRSGGFQNDTNCVQKTTQATNNSKINSNAAFNDNFKKVIVSTANSLNVTTTNTTNNLSNNISKNTSKSTAISNAVNNKSTTTTTSNSTTSSSSKTIIPTASFLKAYTIPPTVLHRSSKARLRSCSRDSLHDEMCHFKPIRSLPLTPLKSGTHSRGGFKLKTPKPTLGTSTTNCDFTTIKRVVDRENQRGKLLAKRRNDSRLSTSIFQNMKPQLSAFVRLQPNVTIDLQQEIFSSSKNLEKTNQSTKSKTQKPIKKSNKKLIETPSPAQQKTSTAVIITTATTTLTKVPTGKQLSSNKSRKRKAQTNNKQNDIIASKKPKKIIDKTKNVIKSNRKTPPLTRGRKRIEGGYAKLVGPLV